MLKVIVLNSDAEFAPLLRDQIQASGNARLVAELSNPDDLATVVQRLAPDVVIMHLHPEPDALFRLASQISQSFERVRLFAIADSDDPQLILTSMRSGMCEYLTKPVESRELSLALDKVEASKPPGAGKGRILATMRSTGGCGATFLAVNVACELMETYHQSVVIVDLDFCGGQVATYLDLTPSFTLGDMAESTEDLDVQMLDRVVTRHSSGVAVLARPPHLDHSELLIGDEGHKLMMGIITNLANRYDYVVLDGLNYSGKSSLDVLSMADEILLTMNLLVPSIRNSHSILQAMQRNGLASPAVPAGGRVSGSSLERILLVINRLGREASYLRLQDIEKTLGQKLFAQVPDDWRTVSRSINAGDPLYMYAPNSKVRGSIVELAGRLAEVQQGYQGQSAKHGAAASSRGGLFGRMLKLGPRGTEKERSSRKESRRPLISSAPGVSSKD